MPPPAVLIAPHEPPQHHATNVPHTLLHAWNAPCALTRTSWGKCVLFLPALLGAQCIYDDGEIEVWESELSETTMTIATDTREPVMW